MKVLFAFLIVVVLFDAIDRAEFPERPARPLLVHTHGSGR